MGGVAFVCRTRTRKALQDSCTNDLVGREGALRSRCLLTTAIHGILLPAQRGMLEPPSPPPLPTPLPPTRKMKSTKVHSLDGRRPSLRGERGRVASLSPDLFCRPQNGGTKAQMRRVYNAQCACSKLATPRVAVTCGAQFNLQHGLAVSVGIVLGKS